MEKFYACIDLKSFYASIECLERKLDPLTTNLVVADQSRTEKTICLALTPSLKKYGLSGRARLYEVIQKIKEANKKRYIDNNYQKLKYKTYNDNILLKDKKAEIDFIIASPRMKKYMEYSQKVYNIYLKFIAPEDIFAYSIDEVFCDLTPYLKVYKMSACDLVMKMVKKVYEETKITATAGVGTNMYLAKVAMDIIAKKEVPNEFGVRLSYLDVKLYRNMLWKHKKLSDFWRIGKAYEQKLNQNKLYTMGDIARLSLTNENKLYKLFGVNAEFLIDHAWGFEPVLMKDIKEYKPKSRSVTHSQVLKEPTSFEQAQIIIKEMSDSLSLELSSKKIKSKHFVLDVIYDVSNIKDNSFLEMELDSYGRKIPRHKHASINNLYYTSSSKKITYLFLEMFNKISNNSLLIRKISMIADGTIEEKKIKGEDNYIQLNLFSESNLDSLRKKDIDESNLQDVIVSIKNKYGKNSLLKGIDYLDNATTRERNKMIGGHSA